MLLKIIFIFCDDQKRLHSLFTQNIVQQVVKKKREKNHLGIAMFNQKRGITLL